MDYSSVRRALGPLAYALVSIGLVALLAFAMLPPITKGATFAQYRFWRVSVVRVGKGINFYRRAFLRKHR
jgi:hypothetical protein